MLHVQYHLVPPFPHFIPKVSLKKDGSVVLNTGDSLIALSISTEVKNDLMTGKHSSKLLPDCYDVTYPRNEDHLFSSGNASTSTSSEVTEAEVSSVYSPNSDLGLGNLYDGSSNTCAQFNDTLKYVTTCKTGSPHGEEQATSQSSSISNESLRFSSDLESTSASSSSVFELFASPGRRSKHKFYSKLELKDEGKSEVFCDSKPHDLNSDVTSNEKEMPEMADECSSPCSENCASPVRPYKHPSLNLRGVSDGSCALRTYSRLPSDEKNLKFGYNESLKENVSPELELRGYQGRSVDGIAKITSDYAYLNPAFPRATSPENGNSSLQTTNCITCASRVFVPHVDANLSNETEGKRQFGFNGFALVSELAF